MVPVSIALRFELTIPVADWGAEHDYDHQLKIGTDLQAAVAAVAGTAVPEAVWVLDNQGIHHPELPSVVAVVNPGISAGHIRLKAQDNTAFYSGLGITAISYKVRLYVQLEHTALGLMDQSADPTPLGQPMWSYVAGAGGNPRDILSYRLATTDFSDRYYLAGGGTGTPDEANFTTYSGLADKIYAFRMIFPVDLRLAHFAAKLTAGQGGGKARMGLYTSTSLYNCVPDALVADLGELALDSSEVKIWTPGTPIVVVAPTDMWLVLHLSQISSWSAPSAYSWARTMGHDSNLQGTSGVGLRVDKTYGPLPSTFPLTNIEMLKYDNYPMGLWFSPEPPA